MKKMFLFVLLIMFIGGGIFAHQINYQLDSEPEFGPFFLPADNTLSSISINYFTSTPSTTIVLFSMVGDIDWARTDYTETTYHRMIFFNMEEEAEYQFQIAGDYDNLVSLSSLTTRPYSDSYEYTFALAKIGSEIELTDNPHFLVLLSDDDTVDRSEFQTFYEENSDLLSSTVIVPMFDLEFDQETLSYSYDGIYLISYKELNLILISDEISDISDIRGFISDDEDDRNVMVFGDISKEKIQQIVYEYAYDIDSYFTYSDLELIGATPIDDMRVVEVSSDLEDDFVVFSGE